MRPVTTTPLVEAARAAEARLRVAAPGLVDGFLDNLPGAAETVCRRLLGAFFRENAAARGSAGRSGIALATQRHAFGRVEVHRVGPSGEDPALVLHRLAGSDPGAGSVATELVDASVNLALAYARRARLDAAVAEAASLPGGPRDTLDLAGWSDADERGAMLERLATEGHNLHPCARTRLGWSLADVLAYDLEAASVPVGFVGIRRDVHIGDDLGVVLRDAGILDGPDDRLDPSRYAATPVHAWQRDRVRAGRYADLVDSGVLVPLEAELRAATTAALRTLLLSTGGGIRYLKLSLDIQVTSTRRSISVASTRNGPVLSRLIEPLLAEARATHPVVLMAEAAGSATLAAGREREFSAIARTGLTGRLADAEGPDGEVAVPGSALYAISPVTGTPIVAELVDRFAASRQHPDRSVAALCFVDEYARVLLPPVLRLATRHGIGLEAHLQNCVPTFVDGVPHRLCVRDLAGLRLHPGRLSTATALWPGSVIVTNDLDVMRAKVAYTALQAHLGELVVRLVYSHGLDEPAAWRAVRRVVDEVYDDLRAEPAIAARAADDHAFFTAPTVPHKALLGMRLAAARGEAGDIYVEVENPLR